MYTESYAWGKVAPKPGEPMNLYTLGTLEVVFLVSEHYK